MNGDGYSDVIVGACMFDNGQNNEGRAFVYHGSIDGLSATPDWTGESDHAEAYFGYSVSTAGDVNGDGYSDIIVGAPTYDNGQAYEGGAFVFHGSAGGLSATPDWIRIMEPNQYSALFGASVSTAGDVNGDGYSDVIVGAPGYDNGQTDEGGAFVYHGSAGGLSAMPDWTGESDQESAEYGNSVSSAGDVNGDGYSDIIIGAHLFDWYPDAGLAYAYYGSAGGLSTTPDQTMGQMSASGAEYGSSVSTAGDVNGDGYSDVIVGAPLDGYAGQAFGYAWLYYGSASGLPNIWNVYVHSDQLYSRFGCSVAAGDVNGDGYSDIIVGASHYDNGQIDEGRGYVYHGSAGGLSSTPDWTAEGDQASAYYGNSVSTTGDVNGDGYSDVIVGAPWYDNGQNNEGRAFVYHGSAGGLSSTPDWTAEPDQVDAELGYSVSTAGDVNGDGYSDVIIGAYGYDNGQAYEGRAFVYHGSASGLSTTPDWTAEPDQAYARFGCAVYTAGDVNGDGYSDVIVGAYMFDNGQDNEGRAYVYHGSAGGLSSTPDWTAESDQADAWFGCAVSTTGDVNGDGYSDVIVGALLYDNGQNNEGGAFVYCGNEGNNVMVQPQQLRDDFSRQIVPPLFTHSNNAFGVQFWGRSVYGRVLAKAQFEVKELGIPFNGSGLFETDWVDLDTTGMEISHVLDGFVANNVYKWRARIKYHLKYGAPIHSRWYYLQSNGMTECDLRVGIETSVNECPLATLYPGLRLSVMYVSRGVKFVCNVPVVMGDGDFIVYNLLGAEIDRIDMSLGKVGEYNVEWSGQDRNGNVLPSGVYFARVRTGGAVSNTVKFILIK